MSLDKEDRKSLIDFRLEKSDNAMQDVDLLVANNRWPAAANRLYYAAYYAVSSLLIAARIESKTHEGIIRMFSKEFVMTKRVDTRFGRIYNDLYTKRITGDYGDSFDVTEEDVRPMVNPTKELISCVKEQIKIIRNKTNN